MNDDNLQFSPSRTAKKDEGTGGMWSTFNIYVNCDITNLIGNKMVLLLCNQQELNEEETHCLAGVMKF